MNSKIVLVAGLGRCGSSLMMQMLQAGGVPCTGEFPAFEPKETNHGAMPIGWMSERHGTAVKLLDPHYTPFEQDAPCVVIFMERNLWQQALSQIKFVTTLMGEPMKPRRGQVKKMAVRLRDETQKSLATLRRYNIHRVSFEDLLHNPFHVACGVVKYLTPFDLAWNIDPGKMAQQVRKRKPECARGLDMELTLISEKEPRPAQSTDRRTEK